MLRATASTEDGRTPRAQPYPDDQIENNAMLAGLPPTEGEANDNGSAESDAPSSSTFLRMVTEAEAQARDYMGQVNRRAWQRSYRAFHSEHFAGSKYGSKEYLNRSSIFIPKTRAAVMKDMSAVAASLFGSLDAVTCSPGNEADPKQRASAAVVQELVNYRTDRASPRASIPWFHVAMGARQTSLITGICLSKQSWKLELRRSGHETVAGEDGQESERAVWKPYIDRPDCQLIPPENFVIDPAADWTNPAQDGAYVIIKWPMRIDEIRAKQNDPRNPWKALTDAQLKGALQSNSSEDKSIRSAREQGIDRLDKSQNSGHFDILWVYETYMRTAGTDWTFLSIGDKHMLTDPAPVEKIYPEQMGERPLALGYGSLEAFRIFPMSNVESWQPLQQEANDIRNLGLDAFKQNVMPVTKVRRGRQVDLDQLKRRGQGTSIMVTDPTDVTWERPPDVPSSLQMMKQQLDIDFDDLAGQQNYGTVADNNALGKTLGGLKLAAGAANAVQEFNIRIWIETWCEVVLQQIVRLIQFYESDPIILGLCGERAGLMEKHGISEITNELIENSVTLRVNIGLGAGDPAQRLQKFQMASQVALPLLQGTKPFQTGEMQLNAEAIMDEVYGAAGYRDGGKRFITKGPPAQNPMAGLEQDKIKSETEKNRAMAKKAILDAFSNAAQVGLQEKDQQLDAVKHLLDTFFRANDAGSAQQGMERKHELDKAGLAGRAAGADGTGNGPAGPAGGAPPDAAGPQGAPASLEAALGIPPGMAPPADGGAPNGGPAPVAAPSPPATGRRQLEFHRGPDGRIAGATIIG